MAAIEVDRVTTRSDLTDLSFVAFVKNSIGNRRRDHKGRRASKRAGPAMTKSLLLQTKHPEQLLHSCLADQLDQTHGTQRVVAIPEPNRGRICLSKRRFDVPPSGDEPSHDRRCVWRAQPRLPALFEHLTDRSGITLAAASRRLGARK